MSKILTSIERTDGSIKSETIRVKILWWPTLRDGANVQWSTDPPHCREVACDVLGVWSSRRVKFIVHAVLPNETLPPMNRPSRSLFVKAIKQAMADELGVGVDGCNTDVIDWEGSDAE